jgi:hypothetical protein
MTTDEEETDMLRKALRRAVATLAVALTSFLLSPLATAAAAIRQGGTEPTQQQLFQTLGVADEPAAYVILVDTSGSMQQSGHYQQVIGALPHFLASLDPDDLVALYTFDTVPNAVQADLAKPSPSVLANLPASADGAWTDFGLVFAQALRVLSTAPADVHIGGIVLLSDGLIDAPDDVAYETLKSPGWAGLQRQAAGLAGRMALSGYGIQLANQATVGPGNCTSAETTDTATCAGVQAVLDNVLPPTSVVMLPPKSDISATLNLAKNDVRVAKAVEALQPDVGKGVTATVSGAPGTSLGRLDLPSGSAAVTITFLSNAPSIADVRVSALALHVSGLAADVTGLPGQITLTPRTPRTVTVRLTWRPPASSSPTGGSRPVSGRLSLTGTVSSPWTPVIRDSLNDKSFALGTLTGGTAAFSGSYQESVNPLPWILLGILVLMVVIAAGGWRVYRFPRLRGTLLIVDLLGDASPHPAEVERSRKPLPLKGRRMNEDLGDLVDAQGSVRIEGRPNGALTITVTRDKLSAPRKAVVAKAGTAAIASIGFRHFPR